MRIIKPGELVVFVGWTHRVRSFASRRRRFLAPRRRATARRHVTAAEGPRRAANASFRPLPSRRRSSSPHLREQARDEGDALRAQQRRERARRGDADRRRVELLANEHLARSSVGRRRRRHRRPPPLSSFVVRAGTLESGAQPKGTCTRRHLRSFFCGDGMAHASHRGARTDEMWPDTDDGAICPTAQFHHPCSPCNSRRG